MGIDFQEFKFFRVDSELLPVTNKADKRRLERRIISDKVSPRQIRLEVRQLKESEQAPAQDKGPVLLPPPCREQPLHCFDLIAPVQCFLHRWFPVTGWWFLHV